MKKPAPTPIRMADILKAKDGHTTTRATRAAAGLVAKLGKKGK